MSDEKPKNDSGKQMRIRVKYEELAAKYANQAILNSTSEEVYLDFSSGVLPDPGTGESVMAVHTRIAMSIPAARRLNQALQQTLARIESAKPQSGRASLPKLDS